MRTIYPGGLNKEFGSNSQKVTNNNNNKHKKKAKGYNIHNEDTSASI